MIYLDNASTTELSDGASAMMAAWGKAGNPSNTHHKLGRGAREGLKRARAMFGAVLGVPPQDIIFTSGGTEAATTTIHALSHLHYLLDKRRTRILYFVGEHKCVSEAAQRAVAATRSMAALECLRHPDDGGGCSQRRADSICSQRRADSICSSVVSHKEEEEEETTDFEALPVPSTVNGSVDLAALRAMLHRYGPSVSLICCMHVNNETGVRQPVEAVTALAATVGAYVMVDAAQGIGKLPLQGISPNVTAITWTAHKFHGPKGVGGAYIAGPQRAELLKRNIKLLYGGAQEDGLRSGTENVGGILASATALFEAWSAAARDTGGNAFIIDNREARNVRLRHLLTRLFKLAHRGLSGSAYVPPELADIPMLGFLGERESRNRAPHILLLYSPLVICNGDLLKALDKRGVGASIGSACNTASKYASHVLSAMHVPKLVRRSVVRFSVSDYTTEEDVHSAARALVEAVMEQEESLKAQKDLESVAKEFMEWQESTT